jgi:hypothetical protein
MLYGQKIYHSGFITINTDRHALLCHYLPIYCHTRTILKRLCLQEGPQSGIIFRIVLVTLNLTKTQTSVPVIKPNLQMCQVKMTSNRRQLKATTVWILPNFDMESKDPLWKTGICMSILLALPICIAGRTNWPLSLANSETFWRKCLRGGGGQKINVLAI